MCQGIYESPNKKEGFRVKGKIWACPDLTKRPLLAFFDVFSARISRFVCVISSFSRRPIPENSTLFLSGPNGPLSFLSNNPQIKHNVMLCLEKGECC